MMMVRVRAAGVNGGAITQTPTETEQYQAISTIFKIGWTWLRLHQIISMKYTSLAVHDTLLTAPIESSEFIQHRLVAENNMSTMSMAAIEKMAISKADQLRKEVHVHAG